MLCDPEACDVHRGTPQFERAVRELLQAARLLYTLRHDNIVTLHGVTMHPEAGHVHWLVTELADGGSLEAWLSTRGVLTPSELLHLLRSVMRALVYLHSRSPSVLHGDIKPSNVLAFTTPDGSVVWKLGDVGIANVLQSTTRARTSAGTLMYTAADILLGPYDGKVDVFSVGIMAAELVVRHMDVEGFELVGHDVYSEPRHRGALVDDACRRLERVCPPLASVVRGCSAVKAKHRMSSSAALEALDAIVLGGVPSSASVCRELSRP
jgi:serine/threonine protein kinase